MFLIDKKLGKFIIVGVINTLVGDGLMFLLYNLLELSYWISSASNYIVGGIVSYFLNKYFTFKNKEKSFKQILLFILNLAICYLIAYFCAKRAVYYFFSDFSEAIRDNIALFAGMCLYTGLNYIGQRLIVFNDKDFEVETQKKGHFMTEELKKILDFHADDFGISKNSSNDIIELISNKYLSSISIMPNMSSFNYAVEKFKEVKNKANIQISVHLNFMEGHCCSNKDEIPDLVDENGYFKISWCKLFTWNYNFLIRKKIMKQLKNEIIAQTQKCLNSGIIQKDNLRFDGHQHTHMIPLVFDALILAIKELDGQGCKTTFIRNTEDPIIPYLKIKEIRKSFDKINLIKCLILNFYSIRVKRYLIKLNIPINYLCGVFLSGNMDFQRLQKLLPVYCKKSENRKVEVLFHPGSVLEDEITEEFVKPDFNKFHLSKRRKIEYNGIISLQSL